MSKQSLKIQSKIDWLRFLEALSRINNTAIVKVVSNNTLTSLVASPDNNLILYSELNNIESTINTTLNIPDVSKLIRVTEGINTEGIELILNSNNIEYSGDNIKFKYHLFDDGFLSSPNINIDKILQIKCDVEFSLTKQLLNTIIKGSSFATDTNKVYIFTESGVLKAELTDRSKHNTDMYSISLGPAESHIDPIILSIDNIRLLSCISDSIKFSINTDYSVNVVDIFNNSTKLKYILASLSQ
jgi:hypothetical protein